MPTAFRAGAPVLAALLALAGCGPGAPPPLQRCERDGECPLAARCVAGSCVANAPPVPVVYVPARLEANALLSFDASQSHDPDPGDGIVSFAWTFRSVDAPCAPPAVAGTLPVAQVRFACPGRYAIEVTVRDRLAGSATAAGELDVLPRAGAPLVTAGPDVAVEHACTRLPARCAPAEPVVLAAAVAAGSGDLAFEWTVEPPADRPLDEHRRVTFSPDPFAASPAVLIETDGQAISGDWVFRLEARDGAGVVGTAATRVSVGNRPPAIQATLPVFHHRYEGGRLAVDAEIPFTLVDPDGDHVFVATMEARQTGAGPATFSAAFAGDAVAVSIAVPYAAPADALHLLGGAGLERAVALELLDVNGGRASEVWPVVAANRPPALASAPSSTEVNHGYDPVGDAYTARVELSAWYDPDGDPLVQVPGSATGDPACGSFTIPDGAGVRRAVADCRHAAGGGTTLAGFVGPRTVSQRVQDPWQEAASPGVVAVTIHDRAPVLTDPGKHVVSDSCGAHLDFCILDGATSYTRQALATRTALARWTDPDGDPLTYSVSPTGGATPLPPFVCVPPSCALLLDLQPMEVCGSTTLDFPMTVSDGVLATSASIPIERSCPSQL